MKLISTTVLLAHWTIVVALSLRIIARRLPVPLSLAWLAVVFAVPFVGALAYLTLGGLQLGGDRLSRLAAAQRAAEPAQCAVLDGPNVGAPPPGTAASLLHRQARRAFDAPALRHNRLELLDDWPAVFAQWLDGIEGATENCRLAFYIWHEGGRADEIAAALERARARGVRCRVLLDAYGSGDLLRGRRVRALRAAGVEVVGALPPSLLLRADLRYHRKILVLDDRVAYTGSQNLADPRFFKQSAGVGQWVDAVLRIEGPAVSQLAAMFEMDWAMEAGTSFAAPRSWTEAISPSGDGALVQVIPSGPGEPPDALRALFLTALYSARHRLTLTTPYFVPDDAILTALTSIAVAGVVVTLILPARVDSRLVRYASAANFDELLSAGVRIALFQDGLLHTKSLVVDDAVAAFGSVNVDARSLRLNFEDSIIVYGAEFAAQLGALQRAYLARSVMLDGRQWRRRPPARRFLESAVRLLGPLL